jgi:hypothetical protein
MHKLIRIIYGVLKSGQPFDIAKLPPCGIAFFRGVKNQNLPLAFRLSTQYLQEICDRSSDQTMSVSVGMSNGVRRGYLLRGLKSC